MELRADSAALAPERLLVFEVNGAVQNFAAAVRRVPRLEWIDEEELAGDEAAPEPTIYLLIPDARALAQLLSLWRQWQEGRALPSGYTPWRDVFALLRALRPWGPADRVADEDRAVLFEEIDGRADDETVRLEIELVFRPGLEHRQRTEADLSVALVAAGGRVLHRSRVDSIAYHAVLAELPVTAVRAIAARAQASIVGLDQVMHVRPQAVSFSIDTAEASPSPGSSAPLPTAAPIAALLDGVPVSQHPLLTGRLRVEDLFGFEPGTQVRDRRHGTAMASLLVHGDRNRGEPPLRRPVVVVPVMSWDGSDEALPTDRLIVDVVYQAVTALRAQAEPLAPEVLIVNLSLGNLRRPFHGQMSPWARLLDHLAWQLGILFVVSAGNAGGRFDIPAFGASGDFEDAAPAERAAATLSAVHAVAADRRIIAPAETVNGLTVGASNEDAVTEAERRSARTNVDPYPGLRMANASSRLGPGFANAVKPDVLMPGGREHLRTVLSGGGIAVQPARAARAFGLRVAAPGGDQMASEHYTNGTSAAAVLASRTCHLIHDALEQAYGAAFLGLPHTQRALCLKAIVAHGARWPSEASDLIRATIGPLDARQHVRQKDNVRRFCGYGALDPTEVVACAADRATFWATGLLPPEQSVRIDVPVPRCMGGQARAHELAATLAWFTPVLPGRSTYRMVRLSLFGPPNSSDLRVGPASDQPDANQVKRGTLLSRRWSGDSAPVVTDGMAEPLIVQRDPDQGAIIDGPIPFALAITLTMPGIAELYEEVRARLAVSPRARA